PDAVPHAPPTAVTFALVEYGNVRVTLFTVVSVTIGPVASTLSVWVGLAPVLPAVSVCTAASVYVPVAESELVGVNVHAPATHGAVPFCVLAPGMVTETVAASRIAAPQAPPKFVTTRFVEYGNVRGTPLTFTSVTTGAVLSTMRVWAPDVPVLPDVSDCVTVIENVPSLASEGDSV